jgi:hypothetical protein
LINTEKQKDLQAINILNTCQSAIFGGAIMAEHDPDQKSCTNEKKGAERSSDLKNNAKKITHCLFLYSMAITLRSEYQTNNAPAYLYDHELATITPAEVHPLILLPTCEDVITAPVFLTSQ